MADEIRAPRDEDEMRAIWAMLCRAFGWKVADFDRFAAGAPPERTLAVFVDDDPVACARIREFGQFFGGRRVAMGGYSPVGVAADHRGRGYGATITSAHYPDLRERGEVLAGLYPATNALYRKVGFELAGVWAMHNVRTRELQRVPRSHGVTARLASDGDRPAIERCYARVARTINGFLDRNVPWWDRVWSAEERQTYVVDGANGGIDGYVSYTMRWPHEGGGMAVIGVNELVADSAPVAHALWRLVGSSSSIAPDCTIVGPPEEPVFLALPEQDLLTTREWRWMARIIDAPGAIAARGYAPGTKLDVSLRISDPQCDWNDGRWRLVVEDGEATLERGGDGAVEVGIGALSSLYTGYASPWQLVTAGLLRTDDPAALPVLAGAFAGPMPWTPDFY
jgi:predicted acetyltransferase